MRQLTESELISLKDIMAMEVNGLQTSRMIQSVVKDEHLKEIISSGVNAAEGRIRGLQQFISENDIIDIEEVH